MPETFLSNSNAFLHHYIHNDEQGTVQDSNIAVCIVIKFTNQV